MAKFTDAIRDTLIGYYNAGDQPTEAQFTSLITAIQEGIEEHQHDSTGDGDATGVVLGPLQVGNNSWIGIGPAAERWVFSNAGHMDFLGCSLGAGTVDVEAWSSMTAIEGSTTAVAFGTVTDMHILSNAYNDVGGWKHKANNLCANYYQHLGKHIWRTAPAAAADAAVVWSTVMNISAAGALQLDQYGAGDLQTDAAGNVTAVSDARLKVDVEPINIGLAEVLQLQGKRWHWSKESGLDTEHWYQGFIADDVEKIVPGAVGRMGDGMKTLNNISLLPAFAKAIQELDARLTEGGL